MINIAEAMVADPGYFKTLVAKDSLMVYYNCPQIATWEDLFTNLNHIIYTVDGNRTISRNGTTLKLERGSTIFLRKGAFQQGRFHDARWQVIVFAVHDEYLYKLISEHRSIKRSAATHDPEQNKNGLYEINTNTTIHTFLQG